jgi:hypothetical protein
MMDARHCTMDARHNFFFECCRSRRKRKKAAAAASGGQAGSVDEGVASNWFLWTHARRRHSAQRAEVGARSATTRKRRALRLA